MILDIQLYTSLSLLSRTGKSQLRICRRSLTPPSQQTVSFPVLPPRYALLARRGHTMALPTFSWDIVGSRHWWWPAIIRQQARGWERRRNPGLVGIASKACGRFRGDKRRSRYQGGRIRRILRQDSRERASQNLYLMRSWWQNLR